MNKHNYAFTTEKKFQQFLLKSHLHQRLLGLKTYAILCHHGGYSTQRAVPSHPSWPRQHNSGKSWMFLPQNVDNVNAALARLQKQKKCNND
jgi:hypothetical protein